MFKNSKRHAPHGQRVRSVRLRKRNNVFQAEELQCWRRYWREPYRFMLAIPWPGFLLSIAIPVIWCSIWCLRRWRRAIFRTSAVFLEVERRHRAGCLLLQCSDAGTHSIQQVATLEPWQGVPTFTFRMVTVRHNSLVDGRTRVAVAIDDHNSMTLVRDQSITFQC